MVSWRFQKPGFTILINKPSNTQNLEKPGFQRRQINPQSPDPQTTTRFSITSHLREKPGFSLQAQNHRVE
jgi:hypothetical protein